ncbi:TPA: hypothetical protein MIR93_25360 [Klebsiella pneumoniae]|nr:hypothetical protein [Klebsiella pneumoniae]HBY2300724.1 hypothetical protein [Klebsiella pneumoniae]HBY2354500.1 hypothetical protein [Klebsiella pneumoniae]
MRASYRQIAPAVLVKKGIQRRQRNYCARKSRSSVRRGPVVSSSCAEKRWLSPHYHHPAARWRGDCIQKVNVV